MRSLAHDARCGVKRLKSNQNGFRRDLGEALLNPLVVLEALEQRLIARKVAPRTAGCEATIQFSWSLEAQLTGERFHQAVLSPYVRGGLVQLLPLRHVCCGCCEVSHARTGRNCKVSQETRARRLALWMSSMSLACCRSLSLFVCGGSIPLLGENAGRVLLRRDVRALGVALLFGVEGRLSPTPAGTDAGALLC